ncbi:hypothetical protein SARC_02617 [Sphaeroforma arctica JP610]|uniref:Uncharacterized protein n=1 Tax=Sphaeroforma arctica JP610 TaxID=667725 RepID=A0A0L0GAC5_9EUKA|nr:hypothetical protein SARC_02617 [Sphaeroforma arctica JP610]KNC85198.1 hypothetical protein SARC_02617 [Sphaeroforma arctica JP610]|eukprot:XP_014159100.1 hypothetical protein SARC_02617 [Sphaeroforma arctica JP610]
MTKGKNRAANVVKAANAKEFAVGEAKQKTPPAPPEAAEATEVTPTQVAPTLSNWERKKSADSGVGSSVGSVTSEPLKPPAKKSRSRKGRLSSENSTSEKVRHALESDVSSPPVDTRTYHTYHMLSRDMRTFLKNYQPMVHELRPTKQRKKKQAAAKDQGHGESGENYSEDVPIAHKLLDQPQINVTEEQLRFVDIGPDDVDHTLHRQDDDSDTRLDSQFLRLPKHHSDRLGDRTLIWAIHTRLRLISRRRVNES